MNMLFLAFLLFVFSFFHVFWVGRGVVDELFHSWSSSFKTIALFPIFYSFESLFLGYGMAYHTQYPAMENAYLRRSQRH